MLLKRILAGTMGAVVLAGGIFYGATYRFFDKPLTTKEKEAFEEQISLPDGFVLVAGSDCYNSVKNTMQAVHDSVNTGAYAIELDVSFSEDSTPYLADGSEFITDVSVPLADVFEKYAKETNLRFVLHLMNFQNQSKLLDLAVAHSLMGRIMLTGFTLDDLKNHSQDYLSFPIAADLDTDYCNLKDKEQCRGLLAHYRENGASMLLVNTGDMTEELHEAILGFALMPLVIRGAESQYEMYQSLAYNPRMIITNHPETLYEIMFYGDHINFAQYENF